MVGYGDVLQNGNPSGAAVNTLNMCKKGLQMLTGRHHVMRNARVGCYFSETWYESVHVSKIGLVVFVTRCETGLAIIREKPDGLSENDIGI